MPVSQFPMYCPDRHRPSPEMLEPIKAEGKPPVQEGVFNRKSTRLENGIGWNLRKRPVFSHCDLPGQALNGKKITVTGNGTKKIEPANGISKDELEQLIKGSKNQGVEFTGGTSRGKLIMAPENLMNNNPAIPKTIFVKVTQGEGETEPLINEWNYLKKLHNKHQVPGIIYSLGFYQDEFGWAYLLLEGHKQSLAAKYTAAAEGVVCQNHSKLATPQEIIQLLTQVTERVEYLHDHDICHYDLHSGNVLEDNEGNAVVCDLGVAQIAPDIEFERDDNQTIQEYDNGFPKVRLADSELNTPPLDASPYLAPESDRMSTLGQFSKASDIYGIGQIGLALLEERAKVPGWEKVTKSNEQVFETIFEAHPEKEEAYINKFGEPWEKALIRRLIDEVIKPCISIAPHKRPAIFEVKRALMELTVIETQSHLQVPVTDEFISLSLSKRVSFDSGCDGGVSSSSSSDSE